MPIDDKILQRMRDNDVTLTQLKLYGNNISLANLPLEIREYIVKMLDEK